MKKLEHAWKALLYDGDTVSVHRPSFYSERFERFMFGKVFVSLPMTESLRRLNAQNKQRPKLKKTPEEDIKHVEEASIETPEIESPSNEQPTNERSPSHEENDAEEILDVPETESSVPETKSSVPEAESAVPELESAVIAPEPTVVVQEPTVTEIKHAISEKTSNEMTADKNDHNLQKKSSLQIVSNVVTTTVTVANQVEPEISKDKSVTVSDEGDAKQNDQFLSQKIDTSSGEISRAHAIAYFRKNNYILTRNLIFSF